MPSHYHRLAYLFRHHKMLMWLPVAAYYGVIFYLSSQEHLPEFSNWPYFDKFAHFAEFLILGFLVARAIVWYRYFYGFSHHPRILALTFIMALGILDEFHQSFVPGREISSIDFLCDMLGGIAGLMLGRYFYMRIIERLSDLAPSAPFPPRKIFTEKLY